MADAVEAMQRYLVGGDAPARAFGEVRWRTAHLEYLANSILDGLQAQALERHAISLHDFLREHEDRMRALLPPSISLTFAFASSSGVVLATDAELARLVFALLAKAARAMPTGGELALSTGWLDHIAAASYPGARPRGYVRLTVSDTGDLADRDARIRLLEPFPENGDMASGPPENIVSIVWRLNGWLLVEHEGHIGTRVHVCLPAVPDLPSR